MTHFQIRSMILAILFGLALLCAATLPHRARADDPGDDTLPALVDLLKDSDDASFQLDILKGMSEALKGKASVKMPKGWKEASAKLSKSANPEVKALAASLSTLFGDEASTEAARKVVMDAKADPVVRQKALASLLDAKPAKFAPFLRGLLADPAVRQLAIQALARYEDPQTPAAIIEQFTKLTQTEKLDALNTLASSEPYAAELLKAVKAQKLPKTDLTAATIRQLSQWKNDEIDKWIKDNWGVVRTSPEDKLADMAKIKQIVLSAKSGEADASRGRFVFSKTCMQCHTLYGQGGAVGPDLTGSGRADLDYLMANVVDPSAVVGKDYLVWIIRTKKDRLISGIIKAEDDNAITVVTENEIILLPRPDIKRMKQGEVSMMPEGLLQGLPRQDLIDLIAYLRSPKQVDLPPGVVIEKKELLKGDGK